MCVCVSAVMNLVLHRGELFSPQLHRSNRDLLLADRLALEQALMPSSENIFSSPYRSRCQSVNSPCSLSLGADKKDISLAVGSSIRSSTPLARPHSSSTVGQLASPCRATILCSRTEQPVERKCASTFFGMGTVGLGDHRIAEIAKSSEKMTVEAWSQRRDEFERSERMRKLSEKATLAKQEREHHKGGGFNGLREAIERSVYNKIKSLRDDKRKMDIEKKAMLADMRTFEAARLGFIRDEKQAHRDVAAQKKREKDELRRALATMGWLHLEARAHKISEKIADDEALVGVRRESAHELRVRSVSDCHEHVSALRQHNAESAATVRKCERRCHSAIATARAADAEAAHALSKAMRKEHDINMSAAEDRRDREQFQNRKQVASGRELYEARKREREAARQLKAATLLQEKAEKGADWPQQNTV